MSEKLVSEDMLINQLEEALEERQTPDRRKANKGPPENVQSDRRSEDRRSRKKRN